MERENRLEMKTNRGDIEPKVSVLIATHRKIGVTLPSGYNPMQVNCANTEEHWENYLYDDSGVNISSKNPFYCELTALYVSWKNIKSPIKGLVHYRRFLSKETEVGFNNRYLTDLNYLEDDILSESDILFWIDEKKYDVLLAMPTGPYPITAMEELKQFCYEDDIKVMVDVIKEEFPEYLNALNKVMVSKNLSYFNMIIARQEVFDDYCQWLFNVLECIEGKCDISRYDTQHKRLFGYLAEVLLNVYFRNGTYRKKYFQLIQPYQFVEGEKRHYELQQHRKKQFNFIKKRKLFWIIENIYRIKEKELYCKYKSTVNFIKQEEDVAD